MLVNSYTEMKQENKNNNKIVSKTVACVLMIMIIVIIMVINNNNNNNIHRRLVGIAPSSAININGSFIFLDLSGSNSIACYNNESSIDFEYYDTVNASCTKSGYQLTGCSSYSSSDTYGVYSDGKSCYSERFRHGPSEFPNELYVQARCCTGMKSTLNIQYVNKKSNNIIKNTCNDLQCVNINETSTGSAIMLGNNNNSYNQNYYQNQGNMYLDTTSSSLMYANIGNITTSNIGLFCGKSNNYKLKCINVYGNIDTFSSVNCTSGYKLTGCDSQRSDFGCGATYVNNYYYLSGSYINGNTCNSYGYNQRAIARCCTIA